MTLRARLFLAFLALALVPTALLTAFTLDRLGRSLQLWNTPGVDQSLDAALEVSKTAMARLEATAHAQAADWAMALSPGGLLTPARRTAVRAGLRASGLDFLQLYHRDSTRWRLAEEVLPEDVLAPHPLDLASDLDDALASGRTIHSARGALAAAARIEGDHGRHPWALTAGMRVPPDFFTRVDQVGRGVGFYRRFGVLRDVSRTYWGLLVVALVLTLTAVALVAATRLARSMTRPLRELEGALERVAAGELETRVATTGPRELAALGERFNTMTARLLAARTALAEAERQAAWREVARRLAHEFKNILTPMSLSLHRLRRREPQVPDEHRAAVADSLAAMEQALGDLTRLAEQFSQYARLPEPRFERLDLAEVARDAARLHEPERVTVVVTPAGGPLPVSADRLLLSRAVHNLLLNACEASPDGATVEVRALREGHDATVEILDRGSGVAPEIRDRLFEPYASTKARGSGLGLSLVRDIAEQHGGRVTLTDRLGGGAIARLSLPRLDAAAVRPPGTA
ncbi:MAG: HAMP domain-containing protein [Candidatus Eisenbacteria bacterium]|uniref:histidine kinase n=1 Tax=Eiseniibacteriota bacterium TaxID=2212470 RepID=A0A538U0V6_UNCEI|nr:MAG: HAMP domain-containing protein [Candidatus Eisenbacteria bacterium]